jgi:hypothetical protein
MSDGTVKLKYEVDKSQIDAAIKSLQDIQKEAGASEEKIKKMGEGGKDSTTKLFENIKGLGVALAGLAAAAGINDLIKKFIEWSDEMSKAKKIAAQLSDEVGYALDALVVKARSLSQTFGTDYSETLKTAMVISRNFGITQMDAMKRIEDGFKRGANATGGYLEALQLGSLKAKQAGYSFDQLNSIVVQLVQSGQRVSRAMMTIFDSKSTIEGGKYASILEKAKKGLAELNTEQQKYYDKMTKWLELDEKVTASEVALSNAWSLTSKQIKSTWMPIWTDFLKIFMSDEVRDRLAHITAAIEMTNISGVDAVKKELELRIEIQKTEEKMAEIRKRQKGGEFGQQLEDEWETEAKKLQTLKAEHDVLGDVVKKQLEVKKAAEEDAKSQEELKKTEAAKLIDIAKEKAYQELISKTLEERAKKEEERHQKLVKWMEAKGKQEEKTNDNIFDKETENALKLFKTKSDIVQFDQKQSADRQKNEKDKTDTETWLKENAGQKAAGIINGLMDLRTKQNNLELQKIDQETQNKLANDKLTAAQRKKIEEEAQKRRSIILNKQAQQDHNAAIINSIINTAVEVTKVIANPLLASIVAGLGAIETGIIASQPIPKYKKGGFIFGPAHESGGVQIEAEGGEAVINKLAVKKYRPLIEKMNALNLDPNFLAIDKRGGINVNIDNEELLKELKRIKTTNINIDEKGFMIRQWNLYGSHQQQVKRFFE